MKTKTRDEATRKLLQHFLKGGKLTTREAAVRNLSVCLPRRIKDFEDKQGYVFKREWSNNPNVVPHYIFFLDRVRTPKNLLP